jgi:hypothetical protein
MDRTLIEVGQEAVFVATTGRRIPVVVQSLHPYLDFVTVVQVADASKVKSVPVEQLRTQDDKPLGTARMIADSALMAPLQAAMNAPDRYECLECGATHNRAVCPECGSPERIENVQRGR